MIAMEELREKLSGVGPCDHEAGICQGACDLIDEIHALELIAEIERKTSLGELT